MYEDLAIAMYDGKFPPMFVEVPCVILKKFVSDRKPIKPGTKMNVYRGPGDEFVLVQNNEIVKSGAVENVHFKLL